MKQLQWYPGHIAKTLKEFKKLHDEIDLFFILIDSRAPKSTYLEQFDDIVKNSQVILIFTKDDLVNKNQLQFWIEKYKKKFKNILVLNLKNKDSSNKKINELFLKLKFKSLLVKTAILGVPNVGKSTLVNNLIDKKSTKVENRAGVTRTKNWFQTKNFWILDSPGILEPIFNDIEIPLTLSLIGSIKVDILPLPEIVDFLIIKAKKLNFFNKLIISDKHDEKYYMNQINSFQKNKFGKIILDEK